MLRAHPLLAQLRLCNGRLAPLALLLEAVQLSACFPHGILLQRNTLGRGAGTRDDYRGCACAVIHAHARAHIRGTTEMLYSRPCMQEVVFAWRSRRDCTVARMLHHVCATSACLFAQLVSSSTQLALAALCLPLHRRGCKLCSICCLALAPAAANSSSAVSITVSIISGCNCFGTLSVSYNHLTLPTNRDE